MPQPPPPRIAPKVKGLDKMTSDEVLALERVNVV
jgi:hypothetical protein